MRKVTQTVEEMRNTVEMLRARIRHYSELIEDAKQNVLSNPTDKNISKQIMFIHEYEKHTDECYAVIRELCSDIEELTGETEKIVVD